MTIALVLTLIGQDKAGLVDTLSATIEDHEGNWLESRMARFAGKFAGILLVAVPEAKADALTRALQDLESQGLRVMVERGTSEEPVPDFRTLRLELVGQDRPGIIHDISHALAGLGVSVDELSSECVSGSMSGENLFEATAKLRVPRGVMDSDLREILEGLANELMVDISLDHAAAG